MKKRDKDFGESYAIRPLASLTKREQKLEELRSALRGAGDRARAVLNRKVKKVA